MSRQHLSTDETGSALLITLLALSLLSLIGLYAALDAGTAVQISDNYETQIQATYAALAGLNHARALIRGLALNDLLRGPDGDFDGSLSYQAQAKSYEFRNPIPLLTAHSLNIINPALDIPVVPDDGLISTGFYGGTNGAVLIPITGTGLASSNPYGPGRIVNSRYFVKITDNNGEASELSGDPGDNPFVDGDGIVIARSTGVSKTFSEATGPVIRRNSVALFEARFKRLSVFDTGPALTVLGSDVNASFGGTFEISGNMSPGIGTIDPDPADAGYPDRILRAASGNDANITGGGEPNPSIREISDGIRSNPDTALLLSPGFLWDFIRRAPGIADSYFEGDQYWSGRASPYAGTYDTASPYNAPGQDPRITVVNGDLHVSGGFSGGGLLIVTGAFRGSGSYTYNGLVLVLGAGNLVTEGSGTIDGGLLAAALVEQGGQVVFGTPGVSINGSGRFVSNRDAVRTAAGLIPVSQTSFREIAGYDP